MKKLIICLTVTVLLAAGCGKKEEAKADFSVIASFYPVYIIAKNITKDVPGVRTVNMTPPVTGCLHDYSVTADDMKHLEKADLFLANGAGMESFMDKIAQRFPALKTAELSSGIQLLRDREGNANPHVWVSVSNVIIMTNTCAEALSAADPVHAGLYRANGKKYAADLSSLKADMEREMAAFRGKKIITFHEAFPYFAKEYGLVIAAVVEREPGSEPSAKELAETIDIVRGSEVKALFAEPQYPSSAADSVSRETGASVYILDPAVTGEDGCDAYIRIMRKNLLTLKKAFKG